MARRNKRKGSSKSGRPRLEGDRYPSGKLKPQGPSETVIAKRQAGDASAGEHPLDFALSNGWITEREHKDATFYRLTYNRAHRGASGPRLAQGGPLEVEPSEALRESWSSLSDAAIAGIFDTVFTVRQAPLDQERAEAQARGKWKLMNAALNGSEREELFMVAVLGSWPLWMPADAAGKITANGLARKCALLNGLRALGRALRPERAAEETITPVAFRHTREGRAELGVRYETTDGEEVQPESERGAPFEVSILRKRA